MNSRYTVNECPMNTPWRCIRHPDERQTGRISATASERVDRDWITTWESANFDDDRSFDEASESILRSYVNNFYIITVMISLATSALPRLPHLPLPTSRAHCTDRRWLISSERLSQSIYASVRVSQSSQLTFEWGFRKHTHSTTYVKDLWLNWINLIQDLQLIFFWRRKSDIVQTASRNLNEHCPEFERKKTENRIEQIEIFIKPLYLQVKSVNRTKRSELGYGSKHGPERPVSKCHLNLILLEIPIANCGTQFSCIWDLTGGRGDELDSHLKQKRANTFRVTIEQF